MLASASAHTVHEQSTLADIFDSTLTLAAAALPLRLTAVCRIDGSTSTIVAVHDTLNELRPGTQFPLVDSFCLQVLPGAKPLVVPDISLAGATIRRIPEVLDVGINAYLGVPIILDTGVIFGTLWVADTMAYVFSERDIHVLTTLARLLQYDLASDVTQRQAERQVALASLRPPIDPSSGLMGYDAFIHQLESEEHRRRRYGKDYTVVLIEIKGVLQLPPLEQPGVTLTWVAGLADVLMRTTRITDCSAHLSEYSFGVLFPHMLISEAIKWRMRFDEAVWTWNLMHTAIQPQLHVAIATVDSSEGNGAALIDLAMQRLQE
ncbi:MAG: GAF domain-containing protein [Herpetosiphonaceae bacterium]|nr:GAF domain-containing protein [Herpetosiphonaceae bacterium]